MAKRRKSRGMLQLPRFDEERALLIFRLVERLRKNRESFCKEEPAHLIYIPKNAAKDPELDRWRILFEAPLMHGRVGSDDVFRFLKHACEMRPELFIPHELRRMTPESFRRKVEWLSLSIATAHHDVKSPAKMGFWLIHHTDAWLHNAKALEHWGDDIRNVTQGARSFLEAFDRIDSGSQWKRVQNPRGFIGLRHKTFNFALMRLHEAGLIEEDCYGLSVDRHLLRVMLQTRILRVRHRSWGPGHEDPQRRVSDAIRRLPMVRITEPFVAEAISWSEEFLRKHKLSVRDVHYGLWHLSKSLCAQYFGNRVTFRRVGLKRIPDRVVTTAELKDPKRWPPAGNPCSGCAVRGYCYWRYPLAFYDHAGKMLRVGRRIEYPKNGKGG